MIAAIYARKSTDQNVADEEKPVTRQVERARACATAKRLADRTAEHGRPRIAVVIAVVCIVLLAACTAPLGPKTSPASERGTGDPPSLQALTSLRANVRSHRIACEEWLERARKEVATLEQVVARPELTTQVRDGANDVLSFMLRVGVRTPPARTRLDVFLAELTPEERTVALIYLRQLTEAIPTFKKAGQLDAQYEELRQEVQRVRQQALVDVASGVSNVTYARIVALAADVKDELEALRETIERTNRLVQQSPARKLAP